MRGAGQIGCSKDPQFVRRQALTLAFAVVCSLVLVTPSFGQARGIPPPTVLSMGGPHSLGAPPPSVTSMGPRIPGYGHYHQSYYNGRYRGYGYGYSGGWAYAAPYYYIPYGDYGYDYDYVGGADPYSGPPVGPNDPTLHIIVEQPPVRSYRAPAEDVEAEATPPPPPVRQEQASPAREAKPIEPTVLIFHDGHRQEVTNYAIMGQTVYVLDDHTQKIPLANLDVAATVKANDDRGLEFEVPAAQRPAQKKNSDLQPKSTPDENTQSPPAKIASALP